MDSSDQTAEIRTELDNVAFVPEETVRGTVTWRAAQTPREVILRLFYYTEGKGTRDVHLREVVEHSIHGSKGSETFRIAAPRRPYSFSGKLISLQWAVEAIFFPSMDSQSRDIVVGPGRQELRLEKSYQDVVEKRSVIRVGK